MAQRFPWDEVMPNGRSSVVPALGRQMRGVMEIPRPVPLGGMRVADNPSGPPMLPPALARPLALLSAVTGEAAPASPPLPIITPPAVEPMVQPLPMPSAPVGEAMVDSSGMARPPRLTSPAMADTGNRLSDLREYGAELGAYKPQNNNSRLKSFLIGLGRGALQGFGRAGIGGALGGAAMGGITHGIDPSADEKYHRLGEMQRTQRDIGEEYKQLKMQTDLETDRSQNEYRSAQSDWMKLRPAIEGAKLESLNDYRGETLALRREAGESLKDYRNRTLGIRQDANESLEEYRERLAEFRERGLDQGERRIEQGERRLGQGERRLDITESQGERRLEQGAQRVEQGERRLESQENRATPNALQKEHDKANEARAKAVADITAIEAIPEKDRTPAEWTRYRKALALDKHYTARREQVRQQMQGAPSPRRAAAVRGRTPSAPRPVSHTAAAQMTEEQIRAEALRRGNVDVEAAVEKWRRLKQR